MQENWPDTLVTEVTVVGRMTVQVWKGARLEKSGFGVTTGADVAVDPFDSRSRAPLDEVNVAVLPLEEGVVSELNSMLLTRIRMLQLGELT